MPKLFKFLDLITLLKYGVAALLLVIPLYPKFPLFNVPGTYVAIRSEDFIVLFLGIVTLAYILKNGVGNFFSDKLNQAILLFWLSGALSSVAAVLLTKTASAHIVSLHWARRIEYMTPLFAARIVVEKTGRARFFIQNLFIAVFFVFLFGFGQIHLGFPVITTQNEEYSKGLALRWISGARLGSTFAGHYDLAAFLVMLLPLSAALFFYYKKLKNKIIFLAFSVLPSFWLMLKAESRVSYIAFLVGGCIALYAIKKKAFIIPIITACLIAAVLFSGLGARYKLGVQTYWQRLVGKHTSGFLVRQVWAQETVQRQRSKELETTPVAQTVFEDRSAAIRLNIEWPRAMRAFAKNPLLGTGYSSISLATDNDYLRALGEVGLVGTLSFLLVVLRIVSEVILYLKRTTRDWNWAYMAGFVSALVGLLVNGMFIDVFEASKVAIIFWALAGIAAGIARRKEVV